MELKACVAYGRKKFLQQRFDIGSELIGQAVLEKEPIYMTEVPKDYVRITSGLGEALPSCILIVPLISDHKVNGCHRDGQFPSAAGLPDQFYE